jgi:hypothetical protein
MSNAQQSAEKSSICPGGFGPATAAVRATRDDDDELHRAPNAHAAGLPAVSKGGEDRSCLSEKNYLNLA